MTIQDDLTKAKQEVATLLAQGHIAKVEEEYRDSKLFSVTVHHYPMCPQCQKESETKDAGKSI